MDRSIAVMPLPPAILIKGENGRIMAQGGLCIAFYMAAPTSQVAQAAAQALEAYKGFVGPEALSFYADMDGEWQQLETEGWEPIRKEFLDPIRARVHLVGNDTSPGGFGFEYDGKELGEPAFQYWPRAVSTLRFWLPMGFLETRGPDRIRALATEVATLLPFNSGHAGLSFNASFQLAGVMEAVSKEALRHPGLDILKLEHAGNEIGTQVRVPHWLTFIGDPVLKKVGGIEALRAHLHEPGTTVEAINPQRAVVTLGPAPTPGEEGQPMPAYRELARVLEPWAYHPASCPGFSPEAAFPRWDRRFLD
ncbi:DUF3396 domain-containing protein [Corallococcus sp. CA053C]|uniref:type VI immunity family protein n=1 Tax=Corallococcus sp. CA053C TaxID=2316732 RepID=UPI000EA2D71B|nr:type VI immunity family protein [Corallococcus sp. CA053C]RKH00053.1 DUF3396 domain-containing protein [Corallococcus sp. CA053C]